MADVFDGSELKKLKAADVSSEPNWFNISAQDTNHIPGDASVACIKEALKLHTPNVSYSQIFSPDTRTVFFGERHDDLTQKSEIISRLEQLKQKEGLTHIALEVLNDADLPYVQEYFAGTGSRKAVLDRINARWSLFPGAPEKYMELLDAAKEAKLIPVALDEVGQSSDDHAESPFQSRNERWADRISDVLKNDLHSKILVYSGRDHLGYSPRKDHANEILKSEFGYNSNVVLLSSAIDDDLKLSGRISRAAAEAGLKRKAFALAINTNEAERPADFVLHQPQ